jgi:uracil-DNA glycosylase
MNPRRFLTAIKSMGIDHYVWEKAEPVTLLSLQKKVKGCMNCGLHETRKSVVFGEGSDKARVVFVGEAPGEEEDLQGRPFVGRAGKLLDELIEKVGLARADVYICNVLKCRPPGNRDPEEGEVEACRDYLVTQLKLIRPRIICTLGRHAYNTLMGTDERITKVRGVLTRYEGVPLLPTYHPSFLLRNSDRIKEAHEDMEKLRTFLAKA